MQDEKAKNDGHDGFSMDHVGIVSTSLSLSLSEREFPSLIFFVLVSLLFLCIPTRL